MSGANRKPCPVNRRSADAKEKYKHDMTIEKRKVTWPFLIAFFLGAVFAELTSDPLSDFIFFLRSSQGPLSPQEQVIYWYYIPALVYFGFFLIVLVVMSFTKAKPDTIKYTFIIFAGVSTVFSLFVLGFDPLAVILLIFPVAALAYMMMYVTIFRRRNGKKETVEI